VSLVPLHHLPLSDCPHLRFSPSSWIHVRYNCQ